ncbi:MAG: hypothetical protein ACREVS_08055 [Burkholderiales bacterium]
MLASAASFVGLLIAALIGVAAGWLVARRGRDRAVAAARETATAGTFQLADELYARAKRATELESKLGAVRAQAGALKEAVAAADERVHALEGEVEGWRTNLAAAEREVAALRVQLQVLDAARQAAARDRPPEAAEVPAVPPPSSRAGRAARLPEDPRPAQHERSGDGNKRDDPKRTRREHRKKYGTGP